MSEQVMVVPVAVMEGVEPSVATTVTESVMPAVDTGGWSRSSSVTRSVRGSRSTVRVVCWPS